MVFIVSYFGCVCLANHNPIEFLSGVQSLLLCIYRSELKGSTSLTVVKWRSSCSILFKDFLTVSSDNVSLYRFKSKKNRAQVWYHFLQEIINTNFVCNLQAEVA